MSIKDALVVQDDKGVCYARVSEGHFRSLNGENFHGDILRYLTEHAEWLVPIPNPEVGDLLDGTDWMETLPRGTVVRVPGEDCTWTNIEGDWMASDIRSLRLKSDTAEQYTFRIAYLP